MIRIGKNLAPWGAAGAVFLLTNLAWGFCRTTTCDPKVTCALDPLLCCMRDEHGCDTNPNTLPIAWPTACVSYAVHEDGSPKLGISAAQTGAVVDEAFNSWSSVTCAGAPLSLATENKGNVTCNLPEYNQKGGNANVWMYRDSAWDEATPGASGGSLDASALAVTTVTFHEPTGQIYDADVELNSQYADFTLGDAAPDVDLLSIATHEAGHFLGLDHSEYPEATMFFAYAPGDTGQRTLSPDDTAAICAIYPEDREIPSGESCDPRRGFAPECGGQSTIHKSGCSASPESRGAPLGALAAALLAGFAFVARRRRTPFS
jgi:MYXO-CTERM domain-containing protein